MTTELVLAVGVPLDEERRLLLTDIHSAEARAAKALAGDRADAVRYEALCAQLEHWAFEGRENSDAASVRVQPRAGTPWLYTTEQPGDLSWLPGGWSERMSAIRDAGGLVVLISLPFEPGKGSPRKAEPDVEALPPAERWQSPNGSRGAKAVEERFEAQIVEALNGSGGGISPSGIQNTVLTKVLRTYVTTPGQRIDVPVIYRDGSRAANPFPLRSLTITDRPPAGALELRLALLSIRHTEMDAIVDGAFLRNSEISQVRLAAETDDLVLDISREQLAALTDNGRRKVHLRIYQTGLETAIVGFYRAVVLHLLKHPGSLAVTPMFYASTSPRQSKPGKGPSAKGKPVPRPESSNGFREGEIWTVK